jgi:signal transduction histidine kinase/Flp pilus assembly protein TadD
MAAQVDQKIESQDLEQPSKQELLYQKVEELLAVQNTDPAKVLEQIGSLWSRAVIIRDFKSQFELALCHGKLLARQGEFKAAEKRLLEAQELLREELVPDGKARILIALGAVNFFQERNDVALDCYFKALACDSATNKGQLYLNIANVYFVNDDYGKSLQYQRKALKIHQDSGDIDHQVFCLSNIGAILVRTKQNQGALRHFEKALELMRKHGGNDYMLCSCKLNLGEVQRRLGEFVAAEDSYKSALKIAKNNKLFSEEAKAYQFLGELKLAQGSESSFLHYQYRSRRICERQGFDSTLMEVLLNLQRHFEKQEDFGKAYSFLKEYCELRTKVIKKSKEKELSKILDHKEREITVLEEQKHQIEQQKVELEKSNRELEKSNKELEQYAYIVAHDLKEPLRNISSFTSLIERRYMDQLDDTAHEYMGYITRNVAQMHKLLTELLRYNTLERKGAQMRELDVTKVLSEVIDQLKVRIEEKGASVEFGELPKLRIHHFHIFQLFQNLIKNALQFNDAEKCVIRIEGRWEHKRCVFSVRDNGIGIDPAYHEKVFKLFNRLNRESYEGTGIGLALCRKIVQIYDGEIWIESQPGKGSTFFFSIQSLDH